jgi:SPP1 gp7 family putative phage head morphogenesis protein
MAIARTKRRIRNDQTRKLEKQLIIKLDKIVESIKAQNNKDIHLLQRLYNTELEQVLRSAIEQAYNLAAEKTVNLRKQKGRKVKQALALSDLTSHFTTVQDLKNIASKVTQYVGTFWRRMNAFLHQSDTLPNTTGYKPYSKLNINSLVTSIGTSAITDTMADATVSKLGQLGEPNEKVKWVTAHDERVCPICEPLDGMIFDINDPSLKTPPDDTHENCRCELEPVTAAEEATT